MTKKYDYVLGENYFDCGIASIMTILLHFGINPSREEVLERVKFNKNGFTAYDLINISKSYGIDGYGIKCDISKIKKFPVIAHTIKDKNMYHFIVILEKLVSGIKIMDPSEGIKIISYKKFKEVTTGIFLVFNGDIRTKEKDLRFKQIIVTITRKYKALIIRTIIISCLYVILSLIFSYYLKSILTHNSIKTTFLISLLFINISLIKNSINYIKNRLVLNLNTKLEKEITERILNHIFYLPYKYFIKKTTGELVTVIEDIENFKSVISNVIVLSTVDLILLFVIVLYVAFINIYVSILLCLSILLSIYIAKKYQYSLSEIFIRLKRLKVRYTGDLINHFSSYETIKNLNINKNIIKKIRNSYLKQLSFNKKYEKNIYNYNFIYLLTNDFFYIIFLFTIYLILIKTNNSLLNIVFFSSIFYLVTGFLNNITEGVSFYRVYKISISRVLDLFEIKKEKTNKTMFTKINSISTHNLTHKYLFKDINIKFRKGDKIYITGQSGVGKSTLMKLFIRYFDDYEGRILIDNIDIKNISLDFLRNHITYVGQNESLFPGTIMSNLKLVSDDIDKLEKAAYLSNLEKTFKDENKSYNFPVIEEANNLSGGERKKIILTRGLLHLRSVLILDEVFNEISLREEREILKKIFEEYNDKIIIVVSHRNSNLDLYNKKYELEGDGNISEII